MRFPVLFALAITLLSACTPGATPPADASIPDAPPSDATPTPDTDAPLPDAPVPPTDTPPADAPPVDAPIDLSTREGFARAWAERLCEAWTRCDRCTVDDGCVAWWVGVVEMTMYPYANFDPTSTEAFLGLLEDAYSSCERPSEREYAELFPYRGDGLPGIPAMPGSPYPVEYGDPCLTHQDCSTLNCQPVMWFDGGGVRGMCYPLPEPAARGPLCR